ncbi:MAG: formimidoylglutamase [Flavobacteriales bacterium]|jgi:arginase family enzyme
MDLSVFLRPSSWHDLDPKEFHPQSLFRGTLFYQGDQPWPEGMKVALLGVKEDRNAGVNKGCADGPDRIRGYLYKLFRLDTPAGLVDLGNIEAGESFEDTCYAVNQTCQFLLKRNVVPVILGGSQDLTYANYLAYEKMEQTVNLVTIDPSLDFGTSADDTRSTGYLNRIVLHKPNYLFNYSNVGHQRYLTDPDLVDLMGRMFFDLLRLGEVQSQVGLSEPALRNADIVSLDVSAIRMSESPGCAQAGPNGFYGEEAAQLCRYAGMSDKLTSFGIYEYNPSFDPNGQSAHLIAQMLWCFLEGFASRKQDYPVGDYNDYQRYIIPLHGESHELVFYKSPRTDRWWMDVPYPAGMVNKFERHHLVPCTYEEYLQATREEMPDRWWKTYQKLV